MNWNDWIGMKVLILKKDGYKRICHVRDCDNNFLKIELLNGEIQLLSTDSIESIKHL